MIDREPVLTEHTHRQKIYRGRKVWRAFKVCDICGKRWAPRGDTSRFYGWPDEVQSLVIDRWRDRYGGDFCATPCFEIVRDQLLELGILRDRDRTIWR